MTALPIVSYTNTPWGALGAIEYRPEGAVTNDEQFYRLWIENQGSWYTMATHQGSSATYADRYDIKRHVVNDTWHDAGGVLVGGGYNDQPDYFKIDSTTAAPAWSGFNQNPQQASSTDKYLHIRDNTGAYVGYMDVWTPFHSSSGGGSGGGGGFLSSNPKIENLTFTKTSDSAVDFSFDWENLGSYTVTNSRAGVVQTTTGNLSGSSGTESASFSLTCQEGDLVWIHGNYNNNALEYHPDIPGSQSNPYVFRVVNFSVSGTTLTATTFFSGSTGLNNDADFRDWDPDAHSWTRLGYINYDGTLQTKIVSPFSRGHTYYVVDRSTGNDYGIRYTAPGGTRRSRGRNFW